MRHMRVWRYLDAVARCGSFRQAAAQLHITPSALQRRVQDVEEDLGAPLFERLPRGVRLTAAGEAFIGWVRAQSAALELVQSRIEDHAGLRRGQVRLACSQAAAFALLPSEVARFTRDFPQLGFSVSVCDHGAAMAMLRDYAVDLALIFNPERQRDLQALVTVPQRLVAIMAAGHPLATRPGLRLRDCLDYPLALPERSFAGRQIAEAALAEGTPLPEALVEANSFEFLRGYVAQGAAVTLQIEVGALPEMLGPGLAARPLDERDGLRGSLVLGQLRGRQLPLPAARFAEALARRLRALPGGRGGRKPARRDGQPAI